jgi:elongator complex protein 1
MYRKTLRDDVVNGNNSHVASGLGGPITTASKVNRICGGFLEVLQTRAATNIQNIITAHVCKSPPDLDAGLSVVAKLRGENVKARSIYPTAYIHAEDGLEAAERAVEHICFLADVNQLYDHALGLYDIDLALLVAQQSQMVSPPSQAFDKMLETNWANRIPESIYLSYKSSKSCQRAGESSPSTIISDGFRKL